MEGGIMYSISITNLTNQRKYAGKFATEQEALEWHNKKKYVHGDEDANPPTAEVTIEYIDETPTYQELRRKEYPPLGELADAIYWQSKGDNTKMGAYLAACEAVKSKYPKR